MPTGKSPTRQAPRPAIQVPDQVRRAQEYERKKQEKRRALMQQKNDKETDGCTFEPELYGKKENDTTRDLDTFIKDQNSFLERKQKKIYDKKMQDKDEEIDGVTHEPRLNDISMAITENMESRDEPTHFRLYRKGAIKLRDINEKDLQKKLNESKVETRSFTLYDSYDPERTFHRGKPAREALYDLHTDILKKKQINEEKHELELKQQASTLPKSKQSQNLRIQSFKTEFKNKLNDIAGREVIRSGALEDKDKQSNHLDYNTVHQIMYQMHFMQDKSSSDAQGQKFDDIYTLLKTQKNQGIMAKNLETVLLVISGERDESQESQNDIQNNQWENSGVYEQESGQFYIREGEHTPIQKHFEILRLNRLQQKKPVDSYVEKRLGDQPQYKPKISKKSEQLAQVRRSKMGLNHHQVDVVEVLLHPENTQGNSSRMELVGERLRQLEDKELTMQPLTNQRKNYQLLKNTDRYNSRTGDYNKDLYNKSKVPEQYNKESDDYWYERNEKDCTFHPDIEKPQIEMTPYHPQKVDHVPNADKYLQRMKKAKEDALFKKKMTERSNFSATQGVKKAKQKLNEDQEEPDFRVSGAHYNLKKFGRNSGFGGVDSAQFVPPKNPEYDFQAPRPPLHIPKRRESPSKSPRKAKKSPKNKMAPVVPLNFKINDDEIDPKSLVDKQLNEMSDRIDERDPKLYVDVNIGKNGMERITVFEGDTAEQLATDFAKKHKLNSDMKAKLVALLDQQIAGVLPKIAEDDEYDQEDNNLNNDQDLDENIAPYGKN